MWRRSCLPRPSIEVPPLGPWRPRAPTEAVATVGAKLCGAKVVASAQAVTPPGGCAAIRSAQPVSLRCLSLVLRDSSHLTSAKRAYSLLLHLRQRFQVLGEGQHVVRLGARVEGDPGHRRPAQP